MFQILILQTPLERGTPMTEDLLPFIPAELLEALNQRFPERSPELNWPDREIWVAVGERRVVRFLIEQSKRQQENLLENV